MRSCPMGIRINCDVSQFECEKNTGKTSHLNKHWKAPKTLTPRFPSFAAKKADDILFRSRLIPIRHIVISDNHAVGQRNGSVRETAGTRDDHLARENSSNFQSVNIGANDTSSLAILAEMRKCVIQSGSVRFRRNAMDPALCNRCIEEFLNIVCEADNFNAIFPPAGVSRAHSQSWENSTNELNFLIALRIAALVATSRSQSF